MSKITRLADSGTVSAPPPPPTGLAVPSAQHRHAVRIAIDPSINEVGWATDSGSGVIRSKGDGDIKKIASICEKLLTVLETVEPGTAIVEVPGSFTYSRSERGGKAMNTDSMGKLNRATGAIIAVLILDGVEVITVAADQWKGKLGKGQARMITGKKNHNEADAVLLLGWARAIK